MDTLLRRVTGQPEGSLIAEFVGDDGQVVLQIEISEGTAYVDELFLRHLVMVIHDIGVPGVRFGVSRVAGRPTRVDRRLWREITQRLDGGDTTLVDLLVVGEDSWWSASANRVAAVSHAA